MKFFWKIFFTTMFISVISFSVGGYFITNFNFKTLLNTEVQACYDFGDIVFQSLYNEFRTKDLGFYYNETLSDKDLLEKVAQAININNTNQKISFCLMDKNGNVVFSSLSQNFGKEYIYNLGKNDKAWTLKKAGDNIYVQAIRPAGFGENIYYIETIQNVHYIFDNQKSQYIMMLNIIIFMLVIAGVITFIISMLLMRQIISLTKVTMKISAGNLGERVEVKGNDEFAMLAQDFNSMADDLQDKIRQLEDETEKKELFVADFSHELKTPLTSIIGYADMLRNKDLDRDRVRFCAEYIFTEGKRLENLSMKLLELIVLRNQDIKVTAVPITSLFKQVVSILKPQLEEKNIKIDVKLDNAVVKVEQELMKTVFINLIDNARKAIDGKGNITITGRTKGNTYIVKICDDGKGMEKDELSKINEAFYMVDKSRSRKQGGAGLGLSICEQILKLHGFSIGFESTVNVGTNVTVIMKGACHE